MHSEQLHKTGFPTFHAMVLLEGTKNLTGERQPVAGEEQHMPTPPCALETWKAHFVGLIEFPEGTGELKWTVFTFLKIPQFLLKLTPLLDKADQRCHCDCTSFLLQECSKQGLLSEASMNNIMAKCKADREHAPWLKSDENQHPAQPWAETLRGAHSHQHPQNNGLSHSESPEGLLGILGHMLLGKSLDLLLAAATATRKLKSFAWKFISLKEFTTHGSEESTKAASV
ncbi:hypothetical protein CB1_001932003 [Camelus ferus]|nr:hypothetical protein CB1_001932003 [Camelus ferus]